MLELYQFELSHYCEKVRLILDYKGLPYRKIEVSPGVGQLEIFQLSGQRQVPLLKDGETIITDSTEIAFYLERKYPEKPIIPSDPLARGQCLLIEDWADQSLGEKGRKALLGAFKQHQNFRTAVLPQSTPGFLKNLFGTLPAELFELLGAGVGFSKEETQQAFRELKQDLEALSLILQNRPYLAGNVPSLADLAVVGLSIYLKFPQTSKLDLPEILRGRGVPGLADNNAYSPFFEWRDRFYETYRYSGIDNSSPSSEPVPINIDSE